MVDAPQACSYNFQLLYLRPNYTAVKTSTTSLPITMGALAVRLNVSAAVSIAQYAAETEARIERDDADAGVGG